MLGADLTAIPTVGVETALTVAAEVGADLSRFATAAHFCSWLGLAPGTRISGVFIKRLFEAGVVTRVLFLVDRIALARQAWISNRVLFSDITFRRYSNLGSCGRNPSGQSAAEDRARDLSPL